MLNYWSGKGSSHKKTLFEFMILFGKGSSFEQLHFKVICSSVVP